MLILHVSDLHLNERWFTWLAEVAPRSDLLCISGDLLDRDSPVLHLEQVGLVSAWLRRIARPLCVCSGRHDLEWDRRYECWRPAQWLRGPVSSRVWGDGDSFELGRRRFHCLPSTTYPKGSSADIWIVHTPPADLAIARMFAGEDRGDRALAAAVRQYQPQAVLCGDVHEPASWFHRKDGVIHLNPGHTPGARFPNYVLFDTDTLEAHRVVDSAIGARSESARWTADFEEFRPDLVTT